MRIINGSYRGPVTMTRVSHVSDTAAITGYTNTHKHTERRYTLHKHGKQHAGGIAYRREHLVALSSLLTVILLLVVFFFLCLLTVRSYSCVHAVIGHSSKCKPHTLSYQCANTHASVYAGARAHTQRHTNIPPYTLKTHTSSTYT